MTEKQKMKRGKYLPAILLGALIAELVYFWGVGQEIFTWSTYSIVALPFIGALFSIEACRLCRRIRWGIRVGYGNRFIFWMVLGALLFGVLGLLIKYLNGEQPSVLYWMVSENWLKTWLLWSALGAIGTLWEVSEYYDLFASDDCKQPTSGNNCAQE
jgi:hypothetical protein